MKDSPNIARVATLIGDNARAEVLSALMSGRALTATELADNAGVTRQTMSSHLAKLLDAGLLTVVRQSRHRYFRLAGEDVARLLESLMGVAFGASPWHLRSGPRDPALRKARVCYDHLAGELGVFAYDAMLRQGILWSTEDGTGLTDHGQVWFRHLGMDTDARSARQRSLCRACLDWSERRPHLAGALGTALLNRVQAWGWAHQASDSRLLVFTARGERDFRALFTKTQTTTNTSSVQSAAGPDPSPSKFNGLAATSIDHRAGTADTRGE